MVNDVMKCQRFSIRKYTVGVCSVVLASFLLLAPGVQADEVAEGTGPAITSGVTEADMLPAVVTEGAQEPTQELTAPTGLEGEVKGEEQVLAIAVVEPVDQPVVPLLEPGFVPAPPETQREPLTVPDKEERLEEESSSGESKTGSGQSALPEVSGEALTVGKTDSNAPVVDVQAPESSNQDNLAQDMTVAKSAIQEGSENSVEPRLVVSQATAESEDLSLALREVPKAPPVEPLRTEPGRTAFRSSTRSASILGDTYPTKWKYLDPDTNIDDWNLYVRYCTSFVAHRLSAVNRFELPKAYGHASQWGGRARLEGYRVDNQPAPGAVAWSISEFEGDQHGHVAWVAAVNGDMVTLEEYNYGNRFGYGHRTVHKSAFTGYIHFKDLGTGSVATTQLAAPSVAQAHGLAPQGRYTFTQEAGVKHEPKLSSPDRDTYYVGESVNYDRVLEADHHVWLSYVNRSGGRSYVAIKALGASASTPAPVATASSSSSASLPAQGRYTFTQRTGVKQEPKLSSPNLDFYEVGESVNYDRVLEAENHVWLSYVNHRGSRSYVAIQSLSGVATAPAVAQPSSASSLPSSGRYTFTKKTGVKNEPKLSSPDITFYGVGGSVNYDRVLQSEGRQWISYMSSSGIRRYALAD